MVSLRSPLLLVAASAALATSVSAFKLTVQNNCAHSVDLYTRLGGKFTDDKEALASGASCTRDIPKGYEGHFRHGQNDAATLVEFATKGDMAIAWYDVSIIPPRLNPGYEFCGSLDECKKHSQSGKGFNVAVQVTPLSNTNGANCRELTCLTDGCTDAYLYPKDDTKTHSCPLTTDFKVTFCPNGTPVQTKAPEVTPAPSPKVTKAPETQAPKQTAAPTAAPTPAAEDEGAGKVSPGKYDDEDDKSKNESGVLTKAPVVTQAPVTQAPVTQAPVTQAPVTQAPVTQAPVTQTPPTKAPVTQTPAVTPAASKTRKPKKPKHCV